MFAQFLPKKLKFAVIIQCLLALLSSATLTNIIATNECHTQEAGCPKTETHSESDFKKATTNRQILRKAFVFPNSFRQHTISGYPCKSSPYTIEEEFLANNPSTFRNIPLII